MQNIKNSLIINLAAIICTTCIIHATSFAEDFNRHAITGISQKLEFSIDGSNIKYELSDIYIPIQIWGDALKKLRELVVNSEFSLSNTSAQPGRHGNYYTTLINTKSHKSIQEILIKNGLALPYFLAHSDISKEYFTAEKIAQESGSGLWKDGNFKIQDSTNITTSYKGLKDKFVIVEGVAENIHVSKKNTFINFGNNWKEDFSIQFDNKLLKEFPGFAEKLVGKKISVRGWLEDYNGPLIKIYELENIEIINQKE